MDHDHPARTRCRDVVVTGTTSFALLRFTLDMVYTGFLRGLVLFFTDCLPSDHHAGVVSGFLVGLPIGRFFGPWQVGWVRDLTRDYHAVVWIGAVLCPGACIAAFFLDIPNRAEARIPQMTE